MSCKNQTNIIFFLFPGNHVFEIQFSYLLFPYLYGSIKSLLLLSSNRTTLHLQQRRHAPTPPTHFVIIIELSIKKNGTQ